MPDGFDNGEGPDNPLPAFSTNKVLGAIATEEFWKANIFQIESAYRHKFKRDLDDAASRRTHVRNLILCVTGSHRYERNRGETEGLTGTMDVGILEQVPGLYPRLQLLVVKIEYYVNKSAAAADWEALWQPRATAEERRPLAISLICALREMGKVKWKSVWLQQRKADRENAPRMFDGVKEIDGRGRDLEELVSEILEHVEVIVRLS